MGFLVIGYERDDGDLEVMISISQGVIDNWRHSSPPESYFGEMVKDMVEPSEVYWLTLDYSPEIVDGGSKRWWTKL